MIDLDGYDIVRKDRSRNGGGVCIYLRSSINYKIRNDLIPSELEAVCVEISKPHSRGTHLTGHTFGILYQPKLERATPSCPLKLKSLLTCLNTHIFE